jgi:hypothetical protein
MLILAIETSTIAASAAVIGENKLYGEAFTDFKLKHSEKLLPLIDHLLADLRMNLDDIGAFAVGAGRVRVPASASARPRQKALRTRRTSPSSASGRLRPAHSGKRISRGIFALFSTRSAARSIRRFTFLKTKN